LSDNKFLFLGAGEAAIGIADLTVKAMEAEGTSTEDARDKIWMVDIDGLLAKNRPEGKLEGLAISLLLNYLCSLYSTTEIDKLSF
jgi:malate dehydrogenase (oxaloacetate-decarboxylating)(NADP+)